MIMQVILTVIKGIYDRLKGTNNRNIAVKINFKSLIISNRTHRVKDLSTGSVGWATVWQSNTLRVWCENYSMLGFSISTEANSSVTYIMLHSHSLTALNFLFCFYIFVHWLISWFFAHWPIGMFKRILLVCVIHCSNETFCGHCVAILKAMVTNTSAFKGI